MSLRMEIIKEVAENGGYLPAKWFEEYIDDRFFRSRLRFALKLIVLTALILLLATIPSS